MELIDRPKAGVRLEIDQGSLEELAGSIQERGLLQPILVRENGDRFEIVAGDRRFLAHQLLGLGKIWAVIKKMTDSDVALDRATENIQRDQLSPIEEGAIYQDLMETHGLTPEQVAKKMGKSGGLVIRRVHLLGMPEVLQKAIHSRGISVTVGEELARIKDMAALDYYTEMAVSNGITQRVARQWVQDWLSAERRKETSAGGGVLPPPIYDDKPIYVTCDTCRGAVVLGEEMVLRVCPECGEAIRKGLSH